MACQRTYARRSGDTALPHWIHQVIFPKSSIIPVWCTGRPAGWLNSIELYDFEQLTNHQHKNYLLIYLFCFLFLRPFFSYFFILFISPFLLTFSSHTPFLSLPLSSYFCIYLSFRFVSSFPSFWLSFFKLTASSNGTESYFVDLWSVDTEVTPNSRQHRSFRICCHFCFCCVPNYNCFALIPLSSRFVPKNGVQFATWRKSIASVET
jgi:hypothetical protein